MGDAADDAEARAMDERDHAEPDEDTMPDGPPQQPDDGDADEPDRNEPDHSVAADEIQDNIEVLTDQVKSLQAAAVSASENGDPETLSRALMKLARVNSALGRNAASAKYLARNADRAARRYRASLTLEKSKKQAVNKSELQAELSAAPQFQAASDALLIAEQADDLCFRTDTFLKMSQSRLSLIKGDIKSA